MLLELTDMKGVMKLTPFREQELVRGVANFLRTIEFRM